MSTLYKRRCVICGAEFTVEHPCIKCQTCSLICKGKLISKVNFHNTNVICATCGKEFHATPSTKRIYCSRDCKDNRNGTKEERKERKLIYYRKYREEHREKYKQYFRVHYQENKESIKIKNNDLRQLRRAIRITGSGEYIDRLGLYQRDRGICGICGKKVENGEISIDHIIPITRGGTHTWGNVQLAHTNCNRRRNDGLLPGQLRFNIPNRKISTHCKLNTYMVNIIRQKQKSVREYAKEYNVAIRTIYDVLQGRTWTKDIEYV